MGVDLRIDSDLRSSRACRCGPGRIPWNRKDESVAVCADLFCTRNFRRYCSEGIRECHDSWQPASDFRRHAPGNQYPGTDRRVCSFLPGLSNRSFHLCWPDMPVHRTPPRSPRGSAELVIAATWVRSRRCFRGINSRHGCRPGGPGSSGAALPELSSCACARMARCCRARERRCGHFTRMDAEVAYKDRVGECRPLS